MQHIPKNKENTPPIFEEWKAKNLPENWSEQEQASKFWRELQSKKNVFKPLQGALLKEQAYICCYCCVQITNQENNLVANKIKGISIEHHKEKVNHAENAFEFENLLASCNSKGSCNLKRNDKMLVLNPCDETHITEIFLERDNKSFNFKLKSQNEVFDKEINEVLNLNNSFLLGERKQLNKEIMDEITDLEQQEKTFFEIKNELMEKYVNPKDGKFPTFAFVAKWIINRKFQINP